MSVAVYKDNIILEALWKLLENSIMPVDISYPTIARMCHLKGSQCCTLEAIKKTFEGHIERLLRRYLRDILYMSS